MGSHCWTPVGGRVSGTHFTMWKHGWLHRQAKTHHISLKLFCVLPLVCKREEITVTQYVWCILRHKIQIVLKLNIHKHMISFLKSISIFICQYESSSFAWKSTFMIIQIFQTWHKPYVVVLALYLHLPVTISLHKIYLCTRPHIYIYILTRAA